MATLVRRWWFWAVLSVVVVGAAVLLAPGFFRSDFKTELAKQLNVEKDLLHLNVPLAKARFPGFTFVIKPALIPIEYPDRSDPDITEGQAFSLDWTSANLSSASGSNAGPIGALFANSQGVKIEIRAVNCKVIEMTLADLKRRLLASSDVLDQAAKGNRPMVIVRSFEGRLEIRLAKTGKTSADVWIGVKKRSKDLIEPSGKQDVELQDKGTDEMVMSWKEPVVFAYEVVEAEIITTRLGVRPDDVRFTPVPATELEARIPPMRVLPRSRSCLRDFAVAGQMSRSCLDILPRNELSRRLRKNIGLFVIMPT